MCKDACKTSDRHSLVKLINSIVAIVTIVYSVLFFFSFNLAGDGFGIMSLFFIVYLM